MGPVQDNKDKCEAFRKLCITSFRTTVQLWSFMCNMQNK